MFLYESQFMQDTACDGFYGIVCGFVKSGRDHRDDLGEMSRSGVWGIRTV